MTDITKIIPPALAFFMTLFSSCSVTEIPAWDSERSAYAQFAGDCDIVHSFAGSPDDITETTIDIPITLHLDPAVDGREIWVEASVLPSDGQTRFEYMKQIPVPQGATSASLPVRLYRTPNLATENDAIEFRIIDSPTVKAGIPDCRNCRVTVTDRFVRPQWWGDGYDEYYNPVGTCNDLKLRLWFEVFGNFDDPRHGSRAWTGADAVIALAMINKASVEKYGKMFHELTPTDVPLN